MFPSLLEYSADVGRLTDGEAKNGRVDDNKDASLLPRTTGVKNSWSVELGESSSTIEFITGVPCTGDCGVRCCWDSGGGGGSPLPITDDIYSGQQNLDWTASTHQLAVSASFLVAQSLSYLEGVTLHAIAG